MGSDRVYISSVRRPARRKNVSGLHKRFGIRFQRNNPEAPASSLPKNGQSLAVMRELRFDRNPPYRLVLPKNRFFLVRLFVELQIMPDSRLLVDYVAAGPPSKSGVCARGVCVLQHLGGTAIGADHPHSWHSVLVADKSDALAVRGPSGTGGHGMLEKRELDRVATCDRPFEDVCFVRVGPKGKRYPAPIWRETRFAEIRSAGCQAADFRLCSL